MNYNLTKEPPPSDTLSDLDNLNQVIEGLNKSWRRKVIKNAMAKADVIPGLEDQRIFNFADRENHRPISDVPREQCWFDIPGKSKARNRPLIGRTEFTIRVRPSARMWPITGILDWGARNLIAAVVDEPTDSSIFIFNAATTNIGTITQPVHKLSEHTYGITAIKWNHAGDRIAVITERSELRVYSMEKLFWMRKCTCGEVTDGTICEVLIVAWTYCDNAIVICCNKNRISSYTYSGEFTQTFTPELNMNPINSMAFSLNDRYYALTTFNFVMVYTWPGFECILEMGLQSGTERLMSLAWHPWDMNVLCVGVGNPCICLCDIQRRELLCCKETNRGFFVDEVAWNKLSGELVVRFDHSEGNEVRSTVAVLSSFNRIVDVVYNGYQCSGLMWSPDNTQLAIGRRNHVKVWNFFGTETRKWREAQDKNEMMKKKSYLLSRRRAIYTDQTRHLEHYNIR